MSKVKRDGKPLKCSKQYEKKSDEFTKILRQSMRRYNVSYFAFIHCRDDDLFCGYVGREDECRRSPMYKTRL